MSRAWLKLDAPIRKISQEDIDEFEKKQSEVLKRLTVWNTAMRTETRYRIWVLCAEVPQPQEMITTIAAVPFEKWEITFQVGPTLKRRREMKTAHPEGKGYTPKRTRELALAVTLPPETSVGDALQMLANELFIEVIVNPSLISARKNEWKALLDTPLELDKLENEDDLTIEGLRDLLCDQLDATITNDYGKGFLYFDLSVDTAGEDTLEEDKGSEKLDKE